MVEKSTGGIFPGGGMSKFFAIGGTPPPPHPASRENPETAVHWVLALLAALWLMIYLLWLKTAWLCPVLLFLTSQGYNKPLRTIY